MSHTHLQTFVPQAPPSVKAITDNPELLNEYLQRMYRDLASNLEQVADGRFTDKRHVVPDKPRDGMIAYADGTDWNPGKGEGFYGYVNGAWVFLSDQQLTGAVLETLFDANTILIATTDNTPVAQTVADNTLVGRDATTGDSTIQDLTATEVRTLINVENGSTADQSDAEIKTAYENNADTNEFSDAEQTKLSNLGLQLLGTATASASSTIEFIDGTGGIVFDSTYEMYRLDIIGCVLGTDERNLWLRLRDTTFQSDAGDYRWGSNVMHGISPTDVASASDTKIDICGLATNDRPGNASGEHINSVIYIYDPASSALYSTVSFFTTYIAGDGVETSVKGAGRYLTNTNAITGLQAIPESGTITSGEFKLYGIT